MNMSKWCKHVLRHPDGSRQPLPHDVFFEKGMYTAELYVSHVYIGPHRNGETFSLSIHVTELVYQPEQNLLDVVDELMQTMQPPPSTPPVTSVGKGKAKKSRRRMALSETERQPVL